MSKILVIDDEKIIRSIVDRILTKAGYKVVLAENGSSGIAKFESEPEQIDLVICDINMDDLSGFEVLKIIRKTSPRIPAIISSGNYYNLDDLPKEINDNIYFLQKPYRSKQLTELIQSILVSQI